MEQYSEVTITVKTPTATKTYEFPKADRLNLDVSLLPANEDFDWPRKVVSNWTHSAVELKFRALPQDNKFGVVKVQTYPRTAKVFRTQAKGLKSEHDTSNYNESDQVQFEVAVFSDGKVAQRWLTETGSVSVWDSWEDLCKVHIYSHPDYGTRVEWNDGKVEQL